MQKEILAGKTALVTGASRGIGKAIALKLAEEGANVVVNYLNSQTQANFIVNEINKMEKGRAIDVKGDVTDILSIRRMARIIDDEFGGIDILVNNAGQLLRPQYWKDVTERVWEQSLKINLQGPLLCIQTFVPMMERRGGGKIVNIASMYGITGSAFVPAYTAAKAGLINLTLGLAKNLAPQINVNAIAPGNIATEMTNSAGDDFLEQIVSETPLKRLGTPEEVADAVLFLSSPMSSFITGHVLVVDGGLLLQ
ncbi:SDR family NAD(P)-dependent oxidoreductase [Candidatus Leptofilum sp.]|uniref:SDR family NAD(P)-dependent oxidoreductase n=1 Tax=Candidatus Leptofilum sp. TaxID=3241576 RepID=UPI003B5AD645